MISYPIIRTTNEWSKSKKLFFFICLVGMGFQLFQIWKNHLRYETEVQTKINDKQNILDIPAITVCTEETVNYLKSTLLKQNPNLNKTLIMIDKANVTQDIKIYYKERIYMKYTPESVSGKYFNVSIKDSDFIECSLHQPTLWMLRKKWYLRYADCSAIVKVLESKAEGFGKCFTYFSQQYFNIPDLADFQVKATKNTMLDLFLPLDALEDSVNERPFGDYDNKQRLKTYLFIHKGNDLPTFDRNDAIDIEPGKRYDIRFTKTDKMLLKAPYDTDCYDYSKNRNNDKPKSVDQCQQHCYREKSKRILRCITPASITANDLKFQREKIIPCSNINDVLHAPKLLYMCSKHCKSDCKQTEYHLDVRKADHGFQRALSSRERTSTKFSLIQIRHKGSDDIQYNFKPVNTFCDSFWKMYLTIIIWFGISIFSISQTFEMAFKRAKPSTIDDRVSPNVIPVMPQATGLQFSPTQVGQNMKVDSYNKFIAQVVEGCNAQTIIMPHKK